MQHPFNPSGAGSCPFAHVGCGRSISPLSVSPTPQQKRVPLGGLFCGPFGEPFRDLSFEERATPREEPQDIVFRDPFGFSLRDPWWDDVA
ncbi:MAG TPA: hypothetical protein PK535_06560 [Synergistaceae bacterium]|jgi:hypothetical protein|nr:MAG: hypothetical protein BWY88_01059 [Synergistetes bacterium ADurb.Bin520]HOU32659.1 hypothetical protein [Synergistaceae bacterium]HQF90526.1 hypothetical protein [Synergistaceae bacterium]HQH78607.1 hypothetical protein [Synergistaceae bacterium]